MAAPGQHLTQGSRMEQRLAARMLPALTILELPAVELGAYLREAYETNEALTLEEPSALAEAPPAPETGILEDVGHNGLVLRHDGRDLWIPMEAVLLVDFGTPVSSAPATAMAAEAARHETDHAPADR